MKVPDLFVGRRLFVGCGEPVGLGIGPLEIRGSAYVEGPMIIGNPLSYPVAEANLMVARCVNVEALTPPPPSIFKVSSRTLPPTPLDVMLGDPTGQVGIAVNSTVISIFNATNVSIISPNVTGVGVLNWVGTKTLTGAEALTGAKAQAGAEARSGAKVIDGSTVINGALVVNGATQINGFLSFTGSIVGVTKEFDIKHPSKKGYRLAHGCLEGPEFGVYYRGKLENSSTIELPDYWINLVDPESITVNLTPHGHYQELFVKSIEWGRKVIIQNNSAGKIHCSYTVYAKRIDIPDLEIEYVGTEPKQRNLGE